MNPIGRVSFHPLRVETEIQQIISHASKDYLVEINWCRNLPMIYGKGRASSRIIDIVNRGTNSDVNRMESTLNELKLY